MPLYIGKRYQGATTPVQSIFRLAGSDEDALTYALGYLLAHDVALCSNLLKLLSIPNRRGLKNGYSIHLQEVTGRGFGRRDIVIEYAKTRIVLEAKIGAAEPTAEQISKYSTESRLWKQYDKRWVVALTQVEMAAERQNEIRSQLSSERIRFKNLQWHKVIKLALKHKPSDVSGVSRYLFNQFNRFIRGDYNMGYYDAEIHIQDVNFENEEIFNAGWVYVTSPKDRKAPLYFAPYFTQRGVPKGMSIKPGISLVSRVIYSEIVVLAQQKAIGVDPPSNKHRKQWERGFSMLRKRGEKERNMETNWGWVDEETRVFYFDKPMKIAITPITKKAFNSNDPSKKIPNQIPNGFRLRFDQLLPRCGIGKP